MQLQAILYYNLQSLPLLLLVDSSTEGNFLDENLALQAGISSELFNTPWASGH